MECAISTAAVWRVVGTTLFSWLSATWQCGCNTHVGTKQFKHFDVFISSSGCFKILLFDVVVIPLFAFVLLLDLSQTKCMRKPCTFITMHA